LEEQSEPPEPRPAGIQSVWDAAQVGWGTEHAGGRKGKRRTGSGKMGKKPNAYPCTPQMRNAWGVGAAPAPRTTAVGGERNLQAKLTMAQRMNNNARSLNATLRLKPRVVSRGEFGLDPNGDGLFVDTIPRSKDGPNKGTAAAQENREKTYTSTGLNWKRDQNAERVKLTMS